MSWRLRGATLAAPFIVLVAASGLLPAPPAVLAALALGVALALLAARQPRAALVVATAVVVLVPFYDGRYVTRAIGLTPMSAACIVLLPVAFAKRSRVRWGALDVAVLVLVVLRSASLLLNFSNGVGAVITFLLQLALPYVVFRLLATEVETVRALTFTVVATGTLLALEGIREHNGVPNPFFSLMPPQYQASQWARPELRAGAVRAEASFGHPIAFGMFLALVLVLTLALALTVRAVLARVALFGALGLCLLALTGTLSRGPLLVAALGATAWLLISFRRIAVLRVGALLAVLSAVIVTTPIAATVDRLVAASTGDTREARSAQYRLEILAVVKDPEQFSLLGKPNEDGSVTAAVYARTGLKSIDSEYALVYLFAGVLALAALLAIAALLLEVAARPRLSPVERAWAVAMAASCLNLLTVALLTQQSELFWASTAIVAGIGQRHRRVPSARAVGGEQGLLPRVPV
jgi:hypothetical protein